MTDTASQIADRAARVQDQVAAAADRAGRSADDVTLIAVTKTRSLETVRAALEAGLRDLGENRVPEMVEKADALEGEDVRWHLIGSLQRNKARDAAATADLFHALDSVRLADALDRRAEEAGRVLRVLVQANVSGEDAKHGVAPDRVHELLEVAAERPHLEPVGLMGMAAIAKNDSDLETIVRPAFRQLRQLYDASSFPLEVLSMGMSGDFEVAVEEGATHIRVGTALFGPR